MALIISISFLLVFSGLSGIAFGSHFRGASLSWKPVDATNTADKRVMISFRIAWRRSWDYSTNCDQSTINSGHLIGPGGNLQCRSGCSGNIGSMNYKCTDFSVQEDWSAGERNYTYTFPYIHPPLYQASFSGNAWISLVNGGGSWEVRMYVNLTKRKDTGLINTSPTTTMSPVVRLQYGCQHTIVIPVSDADKDDIRCRWAEWRKSECAGVCRTFPGAVLDERKCHLQYSATGLTGWYAVAIMVEDFTDRLSRTPLSSVPLQFLVQVFNSNANCTSKPEFTGETRASGSCIGVPHGSTFKERLIAKTQGKGNSILEIKTISPSGLTKSSLAQYSANEWYVNVTWTPSRSQVDPVIFCYTAIDANGLSSPQICITFLAGVAPPYMVNGSHSPTGLIYPDHSKWLMRFDKEFVRPKRSRYIRIFRSDGTAVYTVDVSISHKVVYPAGSLGRTLEFRPSFNFIEQTTYYMVLDPGIVQGIKFCGPESPPMRNPFFWRFTIRDVTPPVVTFTSNPSVTNNSTIIKWKINEPATTLCTLTTPDGTTLQSCNESWVGTGLKEGYHWLSVTATDTSENTARPVTHSWIVDLTPPEPYLTTKPRNVSKERSSTFRFSCRRDSTCFYECSVAQDGASPTYSSCYRYAFAARNLVSDVVYVFRLKARDGVGNQAQVLTYKWIVDLEVPRFSTIRSSSINCTRSAMSSTVTKPNVTDNEDPMPALTHQDSPLQHGCGIQRVWTATDRAGNVAKATQTVTILSSLAPVISLIGSIVVACPTTNRIDDDIKKTINVSHPCGIPTGLSSTDSLAALYCGTTMTRSWTARDNCGHEVTAMQNIKILALQLPKYPKNGQVNVDLNQYFSWPQYPGTIRYKVYIWKSTATKPTTPAAVTTSRVFYPSSGQLPHGTQMRWQIEYVRTSGEIIPSPVWGFVTRHFPDFQIDSISLPPNAFSGQTVSVSWTVRNVGGIGNTAFRWLDRVYIGRTTSFSQSRWMSTVSQERFLFPNDAYVGSSTLQLREDDIGVFYVFVVTDAWSQIRDIDRSNNRKMSPSSIKVSLTPPPNLIVTSIVLPASSFSGKSILVKWTVKNQGVGITRSTRWVDQLYFSQDNNLDNDDNYLGSKVHNGFLSVRQTYTETMSVNIPRAIFGDYFIIVKTDATDVVFENTGENDNIKASTSTFKVMLSPPPDLMVSRIDMQSKFSTGDTANIAYRVTNKGLGTPFQTWWSDQIMIMNRQTKHSKIIASPTYSGVLASGSSYSRKASFDIPPKMDTGNYTLSVHIDIYNQVFEFTYKNNNIIDTNFTINQALPDLVVPHVTGLVTSDPIATYLHINFTVHNRGKGTTYGAPWLDFVYLSPTKSSFSLNTARNLGAVTRNTNLIPNKSYDVRSINFKVPRDVHGIRYVFILADRYSFVLEENTRNNQNHSEAIIIPQNFPDLGLEKLNILSGAYAYSGDSVNISWVVRNNGSKSTLGHSWSDELYLSKSPVLGFGEKKIYEVSVRPSLLPGKEYKHKATVSIPENMNGGFFLIIKINANDDLNENGSIANNNASIHLSLEEMPLPNLEMVKVTYLNESLENLIQVNWKVRNVGYSMTKTKFWADQILLSPSTSKLTGDGVYNLVSVNIKAKLYSQQDYSASATVSIPRGVTGRLYVHVIANHQGKLRENNRDQRNNGHFVIYIPTKSSKRGGSRSRGRAYLPALKIRLQNIVDTNVTCDVPFSFAFEIMNGGEGDASVDSWMDIVYLYGKANASLQEIMDYGKRLVSRIHTGGLRVNVSYTVNTVITISCFGGISDGYLYAFSDVYNRTGWNTPPIACSNEIHVQTGPLPDLQGAFIDLSLQTQEGMPLKVSFNVSNFGEGPTKSGWAYALYLSQDVLQDPFDLKLASIATNILLAENRSVSLGATIFVPYDMVGSEYYLLLEVDSGNLVYELNEDNNVDYVLLNIQKTVRTDILVSSVTTAPITLKFGSGFKVDWTLRNNGTQLAKGYKCDSVYLSQDEVWQIEDAEVGQPKCESTSLLPYNNGHNRDTAFSLQNSLPLVAQGQYRGLVKSRSNIRDPFPNNNIKAGPRNINVTFPLLSLGSCVEADDGRSVFIINKVPPEMTLIVTARVNVVTSFQDLYLRHNKPASSYHYDGNSKFAMSSKQDALVTSTKKGSYYVMLQRNDLTPAPGVKSRVCAKLAKFEISSIFPTTVAPLGNVTLRFEGTLFGWKLEVFLISKEERIAIKAKEVYRFTSTLLYATFNVQELEEGKTFHCKMTDTSKNANAVLNDAVTVINGIPGKLTVTMNQPQAIRLLDTADITVSYQNIGDTDIPSPIIMFSANERSLLRYVQDGRQPSTYEKSLLVVAQPLEGPGGILPPKSSGRLRFQAKHIPGSGTGRSKLSVRSLLDNNEPHLFMQSKDKLKPSHLSDDLWNPVWKNFLSSVGTTQRSFNRRLSSVATRMSLDGRRVHMVDELVKLQLDFANGVLSGDALLHTVDVTDQSSSASLLTLRLGRIYSPLLTRRRSKGIFGVGWIAPWWETSVNFTNNSVIEILHMRDMITFHLVEPGLYMADKNRNIEIKDGDMIVNGIASEESEQLVFDFQTKRLKEIRSVNAENETINVTAYTADSKPRQLEHSAGGSITLDFNSRGLVRKAVLIKSDGERVVSLYTYDPDVPLLSSVISDEKTSSFSYTSNQDLESVTYPHGAILRYTYKPGTGFLGKIVGLTPKGQTSKAVEFQYDLDGLVKVINLVDNSSTTFAFDETMKVLSITGNDGVPFRTRTAILGSIKVKSIIHGDQVVKQETLDTDKNSMQVEDANGDKVKYLVGNNGIPKSITDPAGNVFSFSYDNTTNRLSESRFPDGTREMFDYDTKKNMKSRTTRNGKQIVYEHGEKRNLVKKSVPDVGPTYYLHDSRGNIIMATNKEGTVTLRYNRDNKPTSVTYPDGRHLEYRYNKIGQRIGLSENSTGYNVTYNYDNYNSLSEVRATRLGRTRTLLNVQYDSDGRLKKRILGNKGYSELFYYPETKRVRKLVNVSPFGDISSSFEYDYDNKGRPVKITSKDGIRLFTYDAASQLVGWTDVMKNGSRYTHTYEYDSRGNRVFSTDDDDRDNYETNIVNQYMSVGDNEFVYDKNGNMLSKKNRNVRAKDVKYVFSEENVLLQTETPNERCDYVYDSLGNLYKKKCTSGDTRYLIDPFGIFGSNIIAKISGNIPSFFVHTDEQGLLARLNLNGTASYYEFSGEGSVTGLTGPNGEQLNSYKYDPYGKVIYSHETLPNHFLFVGQWGVEQEKGIPFLYRMRERFYDAELGRFMSYDPLGYSTLNTNLYQYGNNNPIMFEDPQGRIPFPLAFVLPLATLARLALMGGGSGVFWYALDKMSKDEDLTLGGAAGAFVGGSIEEVFKTPFKIATGIIGGFAGGASYKIETSIDDKQNKIWGFRLSVFKGMIPSEVKKADIIRRLVYRYVIQGHSVKDYLKRQWNNFVKGWQRKTKAFGMAIMDWVQSIDPNDILGPTGYGDARYIADDILLDYKIRFENDPNATAPAQRVVINYKLDKNLDPRTLRIGSFGFGNFSKEQSPSPLLQERLDLSDDRNLLVRVTAGIDIVQNEATWDLQSLDPKTGEPPRDPRRGFLPPNNGTTGQGYVTFSVRVKSGVKPLTRIDAKASIIFDRNEAIDTPPIFNTIDNSKPKANLTVLQDLLKKGSLAVVLDKEDIGTGVQSVDIYYQEVQGEEMSRSVQPNFKQLLDDVTEDTAILPLAPGKSYRLVTSTVDYVGNKRGLEYKRSIFVDFPERNGSCSHLGNCSNHGTCSMFSVCVCERRFYGMNCSQEKPPLAPPVLEVLTSGGTEDTPIPIYLFARVGNVTIEDPILSLTITILGLPDKFIISRGMRSRERVILREEDFGNMTLTPPKNFAGNFTLNVSAELKTEYETSLSTTLLPFIVTARADEPILITHDACATNVSNTTWSIPLSINSSLTDIDGSESLSVMLFGLPDGYVLNKEPENGTHAQYLEPVSLTGLAAQHEGMFEPFLLKVVATSVEKSNGDSVNVSRTINVTRCILKFTCYAVNNCSGHGVCVAPNECKCEEEYTGSDCSEESDWIENMRSAAILAVTVGGVLFLNLTVIIIVWLVKLYKDKVKIKKSSSRDTRRNTEFEFNNPSFSPL